MWLPGEKPGNKVALFRDYPETQIFALYWINIIDFLRIHYRGVGAVDCDSLLEIMAQSKGFFDDIKKEIECSLCEEQFSEIKEPKILNCFHTFCKPCLKNWLQKNREGVISCPNRCHKTLNVLTTMLTDFNRTFISST